MSDQKFAIVSLIRLTMVIVGSLLIAQNIGWQVGVAVLLIVWALMVV